MSYFDLVLDITTYSLLFLTKNELKAVFESIRYFSDRYENSFSFWKSLCQKRFPLISSDINLLCYNNDFPPYTANPSFLLKDKNYTDVQILKDFYLTFLESEAQFFIEGTKKSHKSHISLCCKYALDEQILYYSKMGWMDEVITYGICDLIANERFELVQQLISLKKEITSESAQYLFLNTELYIDGKVNPYFIKDLIDQFGPLYPYLAGFFKNKLYLFPEMHKLNYIGVDYFGLIVESLMWNDYISTIEDFMTIEDLLISLEEKSKLRSSAIHSLIKSLRFTTSKLRKDKLKLIDKILAIGDCNYNSLLCVAVEAKLLPLIKKIIALGSLTSEYLQLTYDTALETGSWEIIKFFLDSGVDAESYCRYDGKKSLALCVGGYNLDVVKKLVSYGCDDFESALNHAIELYFHTISEGSNRLKLFEIIKYLLPLTELKCNDILDMARTEVMKYKKCGSWGKIWEQYYKLSDLIAEYTHS